LTRAILLDAGPLVALLNRNAESVVLTLDADFRVYRKNGRQVIPTLMPGR